MNLVGKRHTCIPLERLSNASIKVGDNHFNNYFEYFILKYYLQTVDFAELSLNLKNFFKFLKKIRRLNQF